MQLILDQNISETIASSVTKAIDAGNIGIMVLLAIGLIVLGVIMGTLILRVLVPLLKQVIDLTGQVTTMIQRATEAIEHSNETNTLQTKATNEQTGAIQRVDKNIVDMSGKIEVLALNFGAYKTLQSDTTDALRAEMVSFKGDIQTAIDKMLEQVSRTNTLVEQAVKEHAVIIDSGKTLLERVDKILSLLPPPPPNVTIVNTAPEVKTDVA